MSQQQHKNRPAKDQLEGNPYRAEMLSPNGDWRVVLTRTLVHCAYCGGIFPIGQVGLRVDYKTKTIRNQPRCGPCRKLTDKDDTPPGRVQLTLDELEVGKGHMVVNVAKTRKD